MSNSIEFTTAQQFEIARVKQKLAKTKDLGVLRLRFMETFIARFKQANILTILVKRDDKVQGYSKEIIDTISKGLWNNESIDRYYDKLEIKGDLSFLSDLSDGDSEELKLEAELVEALIEAQSKEPDDERLGYAFVEQIERVLERRLRPEEIDVAEIHKAFSVGFKKLIADKASCLTATQRFEISKATATVEQMSRDQIREVHLDMFQEMLGTRIIFLNVLRSASP